MPPPLTKSIYLDRLVCYLMPYFLPMTTSMDLARKEILETLKSYGARTRAELLNVVQIIAFSMSALDLLMAAKIDTTLSPSLQLRFRGCANNLNRSAQQAEKTLAARLKCDLPAEPLNDTTDTETREVLRRIDTRIVAAAKSTQTRRPSPVFNAIFGDPPPPD